MYLFDITDLDRRSDSKARINGLNKLGLKPVQESHAVADSVKCQHACCVVQVYAYPWGVRGIDGFVHTVMPGRVTCIRAEEAPRFIVVAQQT